MKLKLKELEIPDDNPFANDKLDRQSEIENLTPIVLNVDAPVVMTINAAWGTGKTTFVQLWRAYLEQNNYQSLYFNVWETDYADDPLIPLVATLDKWIQEKGDQDLKEKTWKQAKKLLPKITKSLVTGAVKAGTYGMLNVDQVYEKATADTLGEMSGDVLDNFIQQSQAIDEFKNIITKILEKLGDNQANLIIFIDELDRCRPTYAIELLERIKHLFDIPNLVFVLSTDTSQLCHSICAVYGNNFDSKKYLQRFIDLDYSLRIPNILDYLNSLFDYLKINDYFLNRAHNSNLTETISLLYQIYAKNLDLSLRSINILLTRLKLILYSIPENKTITEREIRLISTCLLLREQNKEDYENCLKNPTDLVDRIKDFPGFEEGEEIMDVMDFLQSELFQRIELLHRINIEV